MSFFNRVLTLTIGTDETSALLFDQSFKINFNVVVNTSSSPNSATIKIYNLSADTKSKLKDIMNKNQQLQADGKKPLNVFLSAGYAQSNGAELIFSGNITDVYTMYQEPNYVTILSCFDGAFTLRDTFVNIAYQNGIDSNTVIQQIVNSMKVTIDQTSVYLDKNFKLANGISLSGKAKNALDNITQKAGLQWFISNGQVRIASQKEPTNEPAIVIGPGTGLIGSPQRMQTQGFNAANVNVIDSYKCKILLQPKCVPFRQVNLQTKDVNGFYTIESVQHNGDTYGDEWTTALQVIDPRFLP